MDHSSQGMPPIGERINQRLTLAERLAIEATYMMCQDYCDLQGKRTHSEQAVSSIGDLNVCIYMFRHDVCSHHI
jgi:hypothetical protein